MKIKKFVSLFLAGIFLVTATSLSPLKANFEIAYADENEAALNNRLDSLSAQKNALEKKRKDLQSKIDSAKNDKDKQIAIKNQINNKINITRGEINVLTQRIAVLQDSINKKEALILEKEKEIEDNYNLFLQRVRAIYMAGNTSSLELILGAKDFRTALMRSKVMESIAVHDQELIDGLLEDIRLINEEKAALLENKSDIDKSKQELNVKKQELDGELSKTQKEIQSIEQLEREFIANKDQILKEQAELQAEMLQIYAKLDPAYEKYIGGEFGWPLPGFSTITSKFGWRFNHTDYHTGIDISGAAVFGKPIVASNAGKVVFVKTNFVQGKGYGKHLIIDHGGGMSTLYAHTSKIVVNVGDTVYKGQKIAEVGSTGWSTGPHLHFEVRKDGQPQNPLGYLK